jgi:hypothetical protein
MAPLLALGACSRTNEADAGSSVRYRVVGGIAGFDLELALDPPDAVLYERGAELTRRRLEPAEIDRLRTLLSAAAPAEDEVALGGGDRVADGMMRALAVEHDGRTWAMTIADPSDPLPPETKQLIEYLMEIAMELRQIGYRQQP